MTVLNILEAAIFARTAGFGGESLVTALAICIAESGLDPAAVHINDDEWHSRDRGLAQINDHYHPEVSDAQAFDPAQAFVAMFTISGKGTSFSPWSTFTSGAYLAHVDAVRAALNLMPPKPVTKPAWTWIGTGGQNIWIGTRLPPAAIVCHIMQGTLAGCDSWFSNSQAQASANFGVGKDGTIHCYVDPDGPNSPFANGNLAQPDVTVQALVAQQGGVNPNYWTVSIEHEGMSGDALTAAQIDASAHLAAWLCQRYKIPPEDGRLLGHYEFDRVTRAQCPGWNTAQWTAWESAVTAYVTPAPAPAPVPDPDPEKVMAWRGSVALLVLSGDETSALKKLQEMQHALGESSPALVIPSIRNLKGEM